MEFTPLVLLLIMDMFLVALAVVFKLKQKYKRRSACQFRRGFRNSTHAYPLDNSAELDRLTIHTEYHGADHANAEQDRMLMTPAIALRKPTGFQQLGDMGSEYSAEEHLYDPAPDETTDLHSFVQSLKKCLGAKSFGPSFEFENLQFQPKKSPKPILSNVSGTINAGSLWGIIGASGAGKCKWDILGVSTELLTRGSYFHERPDGKDITHRRLAISRSTLDNLFVPCPRLISFADTRRS